MRKLALLSVLLLACEGSGGGALDVTVGADAPATRALQLRASAPDSAPAGEPLPGLVVELLEDGRPVAGESLSVRILRGGGALASSPLATGEAGEVALDWTLGIAPVANELEIEAPGAAPLRVEVTATRSATLQPAPVLDLHAYLSAQGFEGTTEDLAFDAEGALVMAVPGALVEIDASANPTLWALTGDPLEGPLGLAFDAAGDLWIADSAGAALRRVTPDGVVHTALSTFGEEALVAPNYVAVGPEGDIYLSDPCRGELLRFDPDSGQVLDTLSFDLPTEGGPNGLAFDASGGELFVTTENTGLLCQSPGVGFTDEVAGLFAVEILPEGFGARRSVAEGVGLFADGLAFDDEGNLFVAVDRAEGLALGESAVEVLPAGGDALLPFLSTADRIFANVAFGPVGFGEGELFVALLAVPAFTPPSARGVERITLGLRGLPLYGVGR